MPIEPSQNIGGLRPVGPVDARIVRTAAGAPESAPSAASANPTPAVTAAYKPSETLDPGQAPVDMERVQVIRKAIQTGTYPVIPTKIADAMIAAGLLLRATA